MQNTNNSQTAHKLTAKELLERAFEEYRVQMERGDIDEVVKRSGETKRNCQEYIRGNVQSVVTGKKIFTELRAIIVERENAIKKLVA